MIKMSLEDTFYPDDGTLINKFDNTIIRTAGKAGEAYQNLTGRHYKSLVKGSFHSAAAGFAVSFMCLNPMAPFGIMYALDDAKRPMLESPLEEETRMETTMHSRTYGKRRRAAIIGTSAILIAIGLAAPEIAENLSPQHWDYPNNYRNLVTIGALGNLFAGLSLLPYAFGHYLSKSRVDPVR